MKKQSYLVMRAIKLLEVLGSATPENSEWSEGQLRTINNLLKAKELVIEYDLRRIAKKMGEKCTIDTLDSYFAKFPDANS